MNSECGETWLWVYCSQMKDPASRRPAPEQDVAELERSIGVRPGMFIDLLEAGDDWAFIVKTHALIETAVAHVLAEVSGRPELVSVFSRLELSNKTTGKLAFAEALDCFESDERRQIRKLSELRNSLVHDIRRTDFRFMDWISGLDPNQFKEFYQAFGPGGETVTLGKETLPSVEFFKANPRLSIWLACLLLLSLAYRRKQVARAEREFKARAVEELSQIVERYLDIKGKGGA